MSHPIHPTFVLCALAAAVSGAWAQTAEPAATEAAPVTLPAIKASTSPAETATGPVNGYRAKRAATATKTDTPLRETPQSITVITRDQFVDQGANTVQDVLNYAAGVRSDAYGLDSRSDGTRIRGVAPDEYLDGLRKSFGYYTSSFRSDPYTLERIEVLRGPAAMLFGQGSIGGLFNLVSKRPQAEASREIGVQYGSFNRRQVQADFTGPLTDDGQWLYRVVGVARESDTQVDYTNDDRLLLSPSLTWKPDGATSLTLQAHWQKDRTVSTSQFLPWSGILTPNPNGQLPTSRFIGEPGFDRYDTDRKSFGWLFEHQFNDAWTVRQNTRYSINDVDYFAFYANSFSSDPTFGSAADPTERIVERWGTASSTRVKTLNADQHVEGKLTTGAVKHTVLAGFDVARSTTTGTSGSDYPGSYGGTATDIDAYNPVYGNYIAPTMYEVAKSTVQQAGVYVQEQAKYGPWIGTAGLRFDRTRNATEGSDTTTEQAVTKRFALMYELPIEAVPYISYTESFTPQLNQGGQSFAALRGKQWELGVKYEPAQADFSLNAAVYDLRQQNEIVALTPITFLALPDTKGHGLELEAKGKVSNALDVVAHYNQTHVDERVEALPKHQASAWAKYRFSAGDVNGLSASAGVRWMSSFHDGAAPTTPSVTLLDAAVAWDVAQWRVALNVNNVTDKVYVSTCLSRGDCWYGSRRNAVASVTYRF